MSRRDATGNMDTGSLTAAKLTPRQQALHDSVVLRATSTDEQLLLLITQAGRVGASEKDVRVVREVLLLGHITEGTR